MCIKGERETQKERDVQFSGARAQFECEMNRHRCQCAHSIINEAGSAGSDRLAVPHRVSERLSSLAYMCASREH